MNYSCDPSQSTIATPASEHKPTKRSLMLAVALAGLVWHWLAPNVLAQTIAKVHPRTCQPGQTFRMMVEGTGLNESLRLLCKVSALQWRIEKLEPTQAVFVLTLPEETPLGPLELWLATSTGSVKPHTLFVDDLEVVSDNSQNHSLATAQRITNRSSVEGVCDASLSDFYRLHADAGERMAVEVHTQQLRSPMDPVLRLLNASGEALYQADDDAVGPDCRFSYQFKEQGDYWLQVQDSRYSAGGAAYQLRIGDFPIVDQCYPLAVRSGEKTPLAFSGLDGQHVAPRTAQISANPHTAVYTSARFSQGQASCWVPLWCSPYPQFQEGQPSEKLTLPVGINGRLGQLSEVDSYLIHLRQDEVIRCAAKTRSLGSPTLLQMQLLDAAGATVAETTVADTDEWSMEATIPEDGDYRLLVSDLLHRGGDEFSYYVECIKSGLFSVEFKADATTREEYLIEPGQGACSLDVTVSRFGYDGAIDLVLTDPTSDLRILNPRIPAKVVEAKVYLTANNAWNADSLEALQIRAVSVELPEQTCIVKSTALRRAKEPHVISPVTQSDGTLVFAATQTTAAPFNMDLNGPIRFARPLRSQSVVITAKSIEDKFKSPITLLGDRLPPGWSMSAAVDKATHTITLLRDQPKSEEPNHLSLLAYSEYQGHGRLETIDLPIQWIDPVKLSLHFVDPFVRGGSVRTKVMVDRDGNDPQPVSISLASLPTGISGSATLTIGAQDDQGEFELQIAKDASFDMDELTLSCSSKYAEQEFTITSTHSFPTLIDVPEELNVYPPEVVLADAQSRQQLVVTGISPQQTARDWTQLARVSSSDPHVAEVRGGVVFPVSDGQTELLVEIGSVRRTIPVRVSNTAKERKIEFETEVLVALSKQGCNSGACHGSPSGKGGFRLSLRAFDKQLDQLTLIREDFGRRVNPLEPERSLLLLKPLMKVAHGGGKQLHPGDAAYKILHDWIDGGATADPVDAPRVVRLEVYPDQKQVLSLKDGGQQLAVTAHYADGRRCDVTHLVAYETSEAAIATVDEQGFVTPYKRGEVAILVRFLEHIESVPLMFVESVDGFEWKSPPPHNYVDRLVNAKLQQLQYLPAETCSDDEFLRRVSLDLLGILPTVEESTAFLADSSQDKRQRLIDAWLQREEFAKFWSLKWGDLLRMTNKLVGDSGVYKYHRWVEKALHENMPYDEFARQLLTASGSTLVNPPANFYRTSTDMNECVETISQVFLGARLQCAKCHNHPFERWTQDNYYGLGAFFNRVERRNTARPGEMFVYTSVSGEVTQPRTGEVMSPWLPQQGTVIADQQTDRRLAFAEWLVNPNNPYFARIEANRIWSQLFTRGIVDPIDDFRDSNPPSNAPLLDALAKDFVDSGYDRKHLLRSILNSRTYQASYQTTPFNRDDSKYFSHQEPRMLGAEQLLDAINCTLALEQTFGSQPAGTLATQLPAPDVVKVDFLKVFGQPERSTVCACERTDDSNLSMAIELFNGPTIHAKLRDNSNRFRKALTAGKPLADVIRELYLAAVCRPPSDVELKVALDHCSRSADPVSGIEDVCWALFNTDEFLFQH
jgi:hypothetical protein